MTRNPWIELSHSPDREKQAGQSFSDDGWQALFACQVGIRAHEDWVNLKWGFNALALYDEYLERQRLFLGSQYSIRNDLKLENPDRRTLAFRYVQWPGEGLMVSVLGKIHARTEAEAMESAIIFSRELHSTFPYDYSLVPTCTRQEFLHISGQEILENHESASQLAQIKRLEFPSIPDRKSPFLHGLWQTGTRAHEAIWRALASATHPLLMTVLLRSTIIYEKELMELVKNARAVSEIDEGVINAKAHSTIQRWSTEYIERRLMPWNKFFYLQIHLASIGKIEEYLSRTIGTALTLGSETCSSPGYQVNIPRRDEEPAWRNKLTNLNLVFSSSRLPIPRLAEVADMDEVFAVMRMPYSPPNIGFPDMNFVIPGND